MIDETPEARRKRRLALPAIGFLGGLILFVTIVAVIILIIWLVGGPFEGAE